jgi:penicillin-binding protein 2
MSFFARRHRIHEIAPDEIFLDATNLPEHEVGQFEGRVAKPVSRRSVYTVGIVFTLIICTFGYRAFTLQIAHGATYADISRNNTLQKSLIFSARGLIYDRTGRELAWNVPQMAASLEGSTTPSVASTTPFALRKYADMPGLSHLLGFVRYPKADQNGTWWRDGYSGMSGVELSLESELEGQNGSTMTERDARGKIQRQDIVSPPQDGKNVTLSIDADMQSKLYQILSQHASDQGFQGGAAVIMDVETGEILAMTSFPEYDHQAFTDGNTSVITAASKNAAKPLLNRAISGLYAPGSIVKPIFAAGALNEGIISPDKQIQSTGAITIPNPYDPTSPSVFHDWRVHGWIDMRTAIAVSSDEYFYTIGGGYGGQKGLGIDGIDKYAALFGLGSTTGIALLGEQDGVIPSIAWKKSVFPDDPWRIGDTYHTAIGQYGFQITALQAVRFISAIANGGKLLTPQLLASSTPQFRAIGIADSNLQIVREGMRLAVTSDRSDATVKALNISGIEIAAKTGTAQIGTHNQWMNSWSVGFWPASHPRYAYAVVLEQAPAGTLSGAAPGLQPFFYWLIANHPEYVN